MSAERFSALRSPLAAAQEVIERLNHQGVIIGGVAASVLGTPRLTAGVDIVVLLPLSQLSELTAIAGMRASRLGSRMRSSLRAGIGCCC